MATVLDEFVLSLNLDSSKFVKGAREANDSFKRTRDEAQKTGRELEDRATGFVGSVSKMRNELLGFLAVFTAGLGVKDFVQSIVGAGIAIDRFSTLTDMSAQDLGAWRNVAERFGGTADGITATIYNLSKELQNFALTGQSSLVPWLRALGIGLTDAHGKKKNGSDLLWDFAGNKYLHKMDPARAGAILANMGLSPSDIAMVLKGRAAMKAAWEDARKSAATHQDIEAAKEFNAQLAKLQQSATALGRTMFTTLTPAVRHYISEVQGFVDYMRSHKTEAQAFFGDMRTGALSLAAALLILRARFAIIAGTIYVIAKNWQNIGRIFEDMRSGNLSALWHDVQAPVLGLPGGVKASQVDHSLSLPYIGGMAAPASVRGLVRRLEGSGDSAVSPAGAIGRFQIMPDTARQYGFDPSRLTDPDYNTQAATVILSDLMARYHGNIRDVLVAYNAGPGRANRFIAGGRDVASLPRETQRYLAHAGSLGYGVGLPIVPSVPKLAAASVHHHSVRTSSAEVHIQTLAVNAPQAKDANGVARSIVPALERHLYASQANSGLA